MSRKAKKKKVRDRLAKKRGKRKKKKKIIPPQKSKKKIEPEVLNNLMLATLPLSEIEELRDVEFDNEKLTAYLESAKKASEQEPIDFIRNGIKNVLTQDVFDKINEHLVAIVKEKKRSREILIGIDAYFKLLAMEISAEYLPMFVLFFAKHVKNHPLADNPKIWKYIMDFLPKKVLSPEGQRTIVTPNDLKPTEGQRQKKEEKRDQRYPHIIIPE